MTYLEKDAEQETATEPESKPRKRKNIFDD